MREEKLEQKYTFYVGWRKVGRRFFKLAQVGDGAEFGRRPSKPDPIRVKIIKFSFLVYVT